MSRLVVPGAGAAVRTINGIAPDGTGNVVVASSGTGNTVTAIETIDGYRAIGGALLGSTPEAGKAYIFVGTLTPPFLPAGSAWNAVDVGIERSWTLVWSDDFDDAVGTGTTTGLPTTEYGGDVGKFLQSAAGYWQPTGWAAASTRYLSIIKAVVAAKMAVQFQAIAFSSNTTLAGPSVWLNVANTTDVGSAVTGYRVGASVASGTASWVAHRFDAGTATVIGSTFTEPDTNIARPVTIRVESDGAGTLSLVRNGSVVTSWTDPATTKLTGTYAAIGGTSSSNSGPSMNIKVDALRVYKK